MPISPRENKPVTLYAPALIGIAAPKNGGKLSLRFHRDFTAMAHENLPALTAGASRRARTAYDEMLLIISLADAASPPRDVRYAILRMPRGSDWYYYAISGFRRLPRARAQCVINAGNISSGFARGLPRGLHGYKFRSASSNSFIGTPECRRLRMKCLSLDIADDFARMKHIVSLTSE